MMTVLLMLIYFAFISLGLPDSMIGAAWPQMRVDFMQDLQIAGVISIITTIGTVISSIYATKLVDKFGTGKMIMLSVFFTCFSIVGIALSQNFYMVCVFTLPLGLGGGAVHAAINNFVAVNCKAVTMNFIHSFWGIGVTLSPLILAFSIGVGQNWRMAYLIVALIQFVLLILLVLSLPLWKKYEKIKDTKRTEPVKLLAVHETFKIKGIGVALLCFFIYNGLEVIIASWGSSYLIEVHNHSIEKAASVLSLFYLGITIGRLVATFLTIKINSKNIIRLGEIMIIFGIGMLFVPSQDIFQMIGFFTIGAGCGPLFANMLYLTPKRYGETASQSIVGLQMAFSYIGIAVLNPMFGIVAQNISLGLLPICVLLLAVILIVVNERGNKMDKHLINN